MLLFATTGLLSADACGNVFYGRPSTLLNTNMNPDHHWMPAAPRLLFCELPVLHSKASVPAGSQSIITGERGYGYFQLVHRGGAAGLLAQGHGGAFALSSHMPQCRSRNRGQGIPRKSWPARHLPLLTSSGCNFTAEHGIMNWLVSYATTTHWRSLGASGANYTAVFFGWGWWAVWC